MDGFLDYLRDKTPFWLLMAFSLAAGMVGAYGRERHEGRAPGISWWQNRAMILPFLAIVSVWVQEQFSLTMSQLAMAAALLSLLGYEAVRIISENAKKRGEQAAKALGVGGSGPPTPKPYHSVVDTDDKGRAVAHVEPTDKANPTRGSVASALKEAFPVPDHDPDRDLLDRLNLDGL